jgi:hypothetical protein
MGALWPFVRGIANGGCGVRMDEWLPELHLARANAF